jgi:tRNA (guanine37-N1)-methyltransferase
VIAHLNLRDQYLQYKHLIAKVLMDKNPTIRTVINKIDIVGSQNEYRTFQYELLAGGPSLEVEVKQLDCTFRFDYSKVYWNTRLNTEHERLVGKFQPGEAVCDVMAGVGPFAVPAGKRKVFVWANDLNPESYACLTDAISRNKVCEASHMSAPLNFVDSNKVSRFVKAFNEDGRAFIPKATHELLIDDVQVDITPVSNPRRFANPKTTSKIQQLPRQYMGQPKTFQHYVMNLPGSAITFLDAIIGIYKGHERLFAPHTSTKLPMIHVHCFSTKSNDNKVEKEKICQEISERIGHTIGPTDEDVEIWDVRDVAPQKRMFCASFRLPAEVAFR